MQIGDIMQFVNPYSIVEKIENIYKTENLTNESKIERTQLLCNLALYINACNYKYIESGDIYIFYLAIMRCKMHIIF